MRLKKGFTLIELLVVISIIALLLSILMPALSSIKKRAYETICGSNMRQVGIAFTVYASENDSKLPTSDHSVELSTWKYDPSKGALLDEIIKDSLGDKLEVLFCPNFVKAGVYANGYDLRDWYEARDKNGEPTVWHTVRRQTGYINFMNTVLPKKWQVKKISERLKPMSADTVKAADHNQNFNYMICHWNSRRTKPRGGNIVYTDGHVEWRSYLEMQPRYGYSTRLFYWYAPTESTWSYHASADPTP